MAVARVPRLWPGETVVCVASGPSLTREDVESVRGHARVIVVNTSYQLAPWADALWATDAQWWQWHPEAVACAGLKFSLGLGGTLPQGVGRLRNDGYTGLCLDPSGIRNGRNGGYAAVNLSVHLGASRIVLLGYDMQPSEGREHWHPEHPIPLSNQYTSWRRHFETLVEPLRRAGVTVLNASRRTALECFPVVSLEQALLREVAA